MRRAFFFIVAVCLATSSFASIRRASARIDASSALESLPETRIRVFDVVAPFARPVPSPLNRALHQAYAAASTTNASGLSRFLSVDPVVDVKAALTSPQRWNRYSYAVNNPMVFTDPTGTTVYLITYTTGNSEGDDEFRRAALTRAAAIQQQKGYDATKDTVLVRGVTTKADFAAAIKEANGLEKTFGKVGNISLFSHSGPLDGPVFHDVAGKSTQFTRSEVDALRVNWADNASASFFGCNTALAFTGMFTRSQGVATDGFTGWANFSSNPSRYQVIQPTGPVYMMTVPPHQLRSLGLTTPWPMTHYTPWPWDGQ
jgi:hypothetical protein